MASPKINVGQELLNVPFGQMIRQMAFAIADAQIRLDENSIEVAEMMGGLKTITDADGNVTFEDSRVFFGNDNLTFSEILNLHNSTNDLTLKAAIYNDLLETFTTQVANNVRSSDGSASGDTELTGAVNLNIPPLVDNGEDENTREFVLSINTDGSGDPWKSPHATDASLATLIFPVDSTADIPQRLSMMELGFAPTFYQFVDTIIEVKISISYTEEASRSFEYNRTRTQKQRSLAGKFSFKRGVRVQRRRNVNTTQVNAKSSAKYSYTAEGSSLLRTKLVPIPPPAILEERIRQTLESDNVAPETEE